MSARCGLELVAIADAAPDNWTFLEKLRPDERAVDFFHACEHLGEVSDRREQLVRKVPRRATMSTASTRSAICHLRDKATTEPELKVLRRELGFFRKHRRRMRYANLKANGCGSGVVEAANKVLVNQRMKRAGMRWSVAGGQNVLTFRALLMSGRFDAAWRAMTGTGGANDNHALNVVAA